MTVSTAAFLTGDQARRDIEKSASSQPKQTDQRSGVKDDPACNLKPGDIILGRIQRNLSGNQSLILVLGKEAALTIQNPQPPGAEIPFMVLRTGPQIMLKLLDEVNSETVIHPNTEQEFQTRISDLALQILPTEKGVQDSQKLTEGEIKPNQLEIQLLKEKGVRDSQSLTEVEAKPSQLQIQILKESGGDISGEKSASLFPLDHPTVIPYSAEITMPVDKVFLRSGTVKNLAIDGSDLDIQGQPIIQPDEGGQVSLQDFSPTKTDRHIELFPLTFPTSFSKGDIIRGAVLEIISPGEVLVSLGGERITATLNHAVQLNVTQDFDVVQTSPRMEIAPVLKVDKATELSLPDRLASRVPVGEALEQLKVALVSFLDQNEGDAPLRFMLKGILQAIDLATFNDAHPDKAHFFELFLSGTGQTLENSLFRMLPHYVKTEPSEIAATPFLDSVNIKSLIYDLAKTMQSRPLVGSAQLQEILNSAVSVADSIELGQIVNTITFARDGMLFFQIPFAFSKEISSGFLSFKFNGRGKDPRKDRREILVVFFLDLTNLGGIRIDTGLTQGDHVKVMIMVEKEEVLRFVQNHLQVLTARLTSREILVDSIQAAIVSRKKIIEGHQEDLREGLLQARFHFVA